LRAHKDVLCFIGLSYTLRVGGGKIVSVLARWPVVRWE
jgi:hypothetical protein